MFRKEAFKFQSPSTERSQPRESGFHVPIFKFGYVCVGFAVQDAGLWKCGSICACRATVSE
eukprot:1167267-Amphidinium_carterae.1